MPLTKSKSDAAFKSNLKAEIAAGKPQKQALAIAYAVKRRARAAGGQIPWFVRNEARNMMHTGPINSIVPGRTDNHSMNVPAGSYVLNSEHIASLGQGNTQAGMAVLGKMFGGAPYGAGASLPIRHASMRFASGGKTDKNIGSSVPIYAAGGEYIISPQAIIKKFGNLERGHKILDNWIMLRRKKHIKTLQKLPPPAKD